MLAGVDNSMRVAQEEIFGPVACVIPFDDEADAIRIANDSRLRPVGLAVDARPRPGDPGARRAIRTGVLSVNTHRSVRTEAPFGGLQAQRASAASSGCTRWHHYTEVKNVFFSSESPTEPEPARDRHVEQPYGLLSVRKNGERPRSGRARPTLAGDGRPPAAPGRRRVAAASRVRSLVCVALVARSWAWRTGHSRDRGPGHDGRVRPAVPALAGGPAGTSSARR